jgi:hypothetical protein
VVEIESVRLESIHVELVRALLALLALFAHVGLCTLIRWNTHLVCVVEYHCHSHHVFDRYTRLIWWWGKKEA